MAFARKKTWMAGTCPAMTNGESFPSDEPLFTLPVRRALVEEGVHALAEILAHIGAQDQIPALFARQRAANAKHRLLGGLHRDWRVAGHEPCGLVGAPLQRLDVGHHLVEQTE